MGMLTIKSLYLNSIREAAKGGLVGEECLCNLQLDRDPASAFQFFSSSLHIMTTTDMLFGGGVRRCRRTRLPPSTPWRAALLSDRFSVQMSTSKSPRSMRPTGVFC